MQWIIVSVVMCVPIRRGFGALICIWEACVCIVSREMIATNFLSIFLLLKGNRVILSWLFIGISGDKSGIDHDLLHDSASDRAVNGS